MSLCTVCSISLGAWLFCGALVPHALALSYSVEGMLTYQVRHGQTLSVPYERHFELLSDDCRWKIKVTMGESPAAEPWVYQYDGTNLVTFTIAGTGGVTNISGSLENSEVPHVESAAGGEFVWLAFASSSYFGHATNGHAVALQELRSPSGLSRRFEVPAEIKLFPAPPYFPEEVRYKAENLLFLRDDGTTESVPLAAPFRSGFVGAEFRSSGFSNVNGFSFPAHFQYKMYGPAENAKTAADVSWYLAVDGTATNVVVRKQLLDLRLPSMDAYLRDVREPNQAAHLRTTNGVIPPRDAPAALKARQRTHAMQAMVTRAQSRSARNLPLKRFIVCSLLATSVVPLVIFLLAKNGRHG